jgi:hypothetical protein
LRKVFDKNGLGLDHTLLLSQRDVDMETSNAHILFLPGLSFPA